MRPIRRREFIAGAAATAAAGLKTIPAAAPSGERPRQDPGVEVLNPRGRVPLSFIIDDSTCLVNMGRYCMPRFAAAWPKREIYRKPWRTWPREIPDDFVRAFGEWCGTRGVKGKYSVVPYPACVGRLDRELPGWSRKQLIASLKLVRELMTPNWDIHPEMITHTRVIDIATGRPMAEISPATMENSYPRTKKSVDELTAYLAYALRILKHCDLPCAGITTPGGFGNLVKSALSLAVHGAVREVCGAELPHYFKYVRGGDQSTEPLLEHVRDLDSDDPKVTVNVPAGTGDWFGGWDGDRTPEPDRYANRDATAGRMVEMIERGGPAVMLCHWPGLYNQGTRRGFRDFQGVVTALQRRYRDRTVWMKVSEIARYWAARCLTGITSAGGNVTLSAPFAAPDFTVRVTSGGTMPPALQHENKRTPLREIQRPRDLAAGTWLKEGTTVTACFDLPKGKTILVL